MKKDIIYFDTNDTMISTEETEKLPEEITENDNPISSDPEETPSPDNKTESPKKRGKKKILLPIIIALSALIVLAGALSCVYFFVKPSFTLSGDEKENAQLCSEYEDKGARAKFLFADISDRIVCEGEVNTDVTGEYTLTYTLSFHGKEMTLSRTVTVADTEAPVIKLEGDTEGLNFSCLDFYKEPGFSASDNYDGDLTDKVETETVAEEGKATVIYRVTDSYGNKAECERHITIKDITPPVITLSGENEISVTTPYFEDPGVTASDDLDGDITDKVETSSDYASKTTGEFTVSYSVKDSAGNEAKASRKLTVQDVTAPVITLSGRNVIYLCTGDSYSDPGYSAEDDFEGSTKVSVSGKPDTSVVGSYTVTYSASDSKGNSSSVSRKIVVMKKPDPVSGGITGGGYVSDSTIYLTFDDGPSNITPRVLDVLAANDVKATFFIINYSDANKAMIQRAINEGHTIAIHGYSHEYSEIYASPDAFINNVSKLHDKLVSDFGYDTNILRFPGGSSNKVSAHYCNGIMSELCPLVQSMGYTYFDWNIESGDAAGYGISSYTLYSNVIKYLKHGRNNVVLFHDAGGKTTTPDAVRSVIEYGKANGYTFAGLSSNTPPVHHNINN